MIPLDQSFDIVNAWLTTTYEVKFHGDSNFKTGDTFYLGEDGTCVEPSPTPPTPTPDTPCIMNFENGDLSLKMTYDSSSLLVNYLV